MSLRFTTNIVEYDVIFMVYYFWTINEISGCCKEVQMNQRKKALHLFEAPDKLITPAGARNKASVIHDYAKNGGAGVVWPSCSFYHDPLRY